MNIKIFRVIINKEGEAVPPDMVTGTFKIVFIREDGWTLAVPAGDPKNALESTAYSLWADKWFAYYDPKTETVHPIERYRQLQKQREQT